MTALPLSAARIAPGDPRWYGWQAVALLRSLAGAACLRPPLLF